MTRLSILGIRPAALRRGDEIGGRKDVALLRAQPRHRLVVAHLALRQCHDRLQVEVDAVGIDGRADRRQQLVLLADGRRRRAEVLARRLQVIAGAGSVLGLTGAGAGAVCARPNSVSTVSWWATVSASCLVSAPSSSISLASGSVKMWALSGVLTFSSAARRRPSSATCRARSLLPCASSRKLNAEAGARPPLIHDHVVDRKRGKHDDRDRRRLHLIETGREIKRARRWNRRSAPCRVR